MNFHMQYRFSSFSAYYSDPREKKNLLTLCQTTIVSLVLCFLIYKANLKLNSRKQNYIVLPKKFGR